MALQKSLTKKQMQLLYSKTRSRGIYSILTEIKDGLICMSLARQPSASKAAEYLKMERQALYVIRKRLGYPAEQRGVKKKSK